MTASSLNGGSMGPIETDSVPDLPAVLRRGARERGTEVTIRGVRAGSAKRELGLCAGDFR